MNHFKRYKKWLAPKYYVLIYGLVNEAEVGNSVWLIIIILNRRIIYYLNRCFINLIARSKILTFHLSNILITFFSCGNSYESSSHRGLRQGGISESHRRRNHMVRDSAPEKGGIWNCNYYDSNFPHCIDTIASAGRNSLIRWRTALAKHRRNGIYTDN